MLFILFNRPSTARRVFERIKQARPPRLYIAADGPRAGNASDAELCQQTRMIASQIDWQCELHLLFQDENLGCKYGPLTAINWFFSQELEGIILEDDCVPDPAFFPYCSDLLERYRDNERILTISGFNFGYKPENPKYSYFFSRYMNPVGWASWKRSLNLVDYQLKQWNQMKKVSFLHRHTRNSLLDFDWKWVKDWRKTFDELVNNNVNAWDYYWMFAGMKYDTLTIFPTRDLIENIGFDDSATHTKNSDSPMAQVKAETLIFPLSHPSRIRRDKYFEEEYIKKVWQSYSRKGFTYQIKTFLREEVLPNLQKK